MASTSTITDPHSLSLKVLRLSRPTLATQTALPDTSFPGGLEIKKESSLAYASDDASSFPLTPLLTLPASFGLAYVGESFACTLCVNNELEEGSGRAVSALEVTATMQTPSDPTGTALQLERADKASDGIFPGSTTQLIVRQDLKESGPHVLAVMVTYKETLAGEQQSTVRTRTFRKLYQFVAQQLIAVRSKVSSRRARENQPRSWIIEAQLENVGESSVTLEKVSIDAQDGLVGTLLDHEPLRHVPVTLKPQDVEQMMFTVKSEAENTAALVRRQLAQLTVNWRSTMGEPGHLSTGWLRSKD